MRDEDMTIMDYRWRGLNQESRERLILAGISSRIRHFLEDNPEIKALIRKNACHYDSITTLILTHSALKAICDIDVGGFSLGEAMRTSEEAKEAVEEGVYRYIWG